MIMRRSNILAPRLRSGTGSAGFPREGGHVAGLPHWFTSAFRAGSVAVWLVGWLLATLLPASSTAGPVVTNVAVVNLTPGTFSVLWYATPGTVPTLNVFADPAGHTNLAGQLGIEYYPLNTGSPSATNSYDRRLGQAVLRQKTAAQGFVLARVSGCGPGQTFYYQLRSADGQGGVTTWPASGPLPAATTAVDSSFVIQSRQLAFSVPGIDPSGSVVLLSNSNSPSLLAAVVGDGVRSNEVYFSLSDLLDASGKTNYLPVGNQSFTATVLGAASPEVQTYSLNFTTGFLVGQGALIDLGDYAVLSFGSNYVQAGASGSLPVGVYASAITNLTFSFQVPSNVFSHLALQPVSPLVGVASLHLVNGTTAVASLAAAVGKTLEGDQQLAELQYDTIPSQPSSFVPLVPSSLQAVNPDGSLVVNLAASPGRLVVVNHQPLVENLFDASGDRSLALYGLPGFSYEIQESVNSSPWANIITVPMTNLLEVFPGMDTNATLVAYRAVEFTANPPILQAGLKGGKGTLLLYGVPGDDYLVQYATNLSHSVTWYPLLTCALTNSFQYVGNVPATNRTIFYRLLRQQPKPPRPAPAPAPAR